MQSTPSPAVQVPLSARMPSTATERVGVLISNLGTPDSVAVSDVRRYLRQFLMDPAVVDIPFVARWLLVHAIILPLRPKKSAHAYSKIFTGRGSPLLFHTLDLAEKVKAGLGAGFEVEVGMRYGNPSIERAVTKLLARGVTRLVFIPLYPQHSLAATESSFTEYRRVLSALGVSLPSREIGAFYARPEFSDAFEARIRESMSAFRPDHVLFSYHGIPERHVQKTDRSNGGAKHCLAGGDCCAELRDANRDCYRAQSFWNTREFARRLGLSREQWTIGFQSRLGRTPWISPYTDHLLDELPRQGVKRLLVACPSFVADCLETLEEIEIRAREQFIAAGGEDLALVPSLNSEDSWARAVAHWVREA